MFVSHEISYIQKNGDSPKRVEIENRVYWVNEICVCLKFEENNVDWNVQDPDKVEPILDGKFYHLWEHPQFQVISVYKK